jgi:hypothetical protein
MPLLKPLKTHQNYIIYIVLAKYFRLSGAITFNLYIRYTWYTHLVSHVEQTSENLDTKCRGLKFLT